MGSLRDGTYSAGQYFVIVEFHFDWHRDDKGPQQLRVLDYVATFVSASNDMFRIGPKLVCDDRFLKFF